MGALLLFIGWLFGALIVAALLYCIYHDIRRWVLMNLGKIMFDFIMAMIEQMDFEVFWAEYGDRIMAKVFTKMGM